jgi:hypothetical protein
MILFPQKPIYWAQISDRLTADTLRDCRKSPIMAILAISHVMKSICYKHQVRRFRVFRQSLRVPQLLQFYRYETDITTGNLEKSENFKSICS